MATLPAFNPRDPAFHDDPYPVYHAYRQVGPVQLGLPVQPGDDPLVWHIFGYREAVQALKDPRMLRGPLMDNRSELPPGAFSILMMDPPDHTRLRQLVSRTFTPRALERFLPTIDQLTEEVLAETDGRPTIDLVADVAYPLPVTVISALLGIPLEDRVSLRRWSHSLTAALDVVGDRALFAAAAAAHQALFDYLRDAVRERRRHPQTDLLSELLAAEAAGDRLSDEELIPLLGLLVVAGHETTVNLITNGLWALAHDVAVRERVSREGLTISGVEELVRFDSPVQATARVAGAQVVVGDQTLPAGAKVNVWLGAANRDPGQFEEPDRLDLDREPHHHLAFGGGIHSCLGATLAVMEGRAALGGLLRHHPDLEVVDASAQRRTGVLFRGLDALTVTL